MQMREVTAVPLGSRDLLMHSGQWRASHHVPASLPPIERASHVSGGSFRLPPPTNVGGSLGRLAMGGSLERLA